jgi:hypothetical protein
VGKYNLRPTLAAIMQIPRRAEQQNTETLAETFVDAGPLLASLSRPEHQVMYGRRGTGKTHALAALRSSLENRALCVISLDLRTIGSAGGMYADSRHSPEVRASRLLIDVLEAVQNELSDLALAAPEGTRDPTHLLQATDQLAEAALDVEVIGPVEAETTVTDDRDATSSAGAKFAVSPPSASFELSSTNTKKLSRSLRSKVTGDARYTVRFGTLSGALSRCVRELPRQQLWILLDEWSAIPIELQPVLADLLRRAVFPVRGTVVKIASIERRSRFSVRGRDGDYLGIELGADVSQDVNLDDYLVYNEKDDRSTQFLQEILARHIVAVSPTLRPSDKYGSRINFYVADLVLSDLFGNGAFEELVRAAEGVPRDFINVASLAAQRASGYGGNVAPIRLEDVRDSARRWFLLDKENAVRSDRGMVNALGNITTFAVQKRRRSFFLERKYDAQNDIIQDLYDARLIHLLRSAVGPGARFDLFALDYGGYVASVQTDDDVANWYKVGQITWIDSHGTGAIAGIEDATLTLAEIVGSTSKPAASKRRRR